MTDEPDYGRLRALLERLEQIQRESEEIRARIAQIRSARAEWPPRPAVVRHVTEPSPASDSHAPDRRDDSEPTGQ